MPDALPSDTFETTEDRFERYIDSFINVLGHADRMEPFHAYCSGLVLPGDRKSVEPMAALLAPATVSAKRQSMHHFVAKAPWSEIGMLRQARKYGMRLFEGRPYCFILDDTGMPKKGAQSVGVAKQWCGVLGKQENCQVAVTLSLGNEQASLPIAFRLYLPEQEWANDRARRARAGVPEEFAFETKAEIAQLQIAAALAEGLRPEVVLGDAGYGNSTELRDKLTAWELPYAMGVQGTTTVWAPGTAPVVPPYKGRGRHPKCLQRGEHAPVKIKDLAMSLPPEAYREVGWREGTKGPMTGRYAIMRVRPAHRDERRHEPRPEEWLLVEWPAGEKEPTHYHLSTLPADATPEQLVGAVRKRWRIERDYQELKDELGLDHYEGRSWRGFHHHAALTIATYAFLMVERGCFPPGARGGRPRVHVPERPAGFKARGTSATSRTA